MHCERAFCATRSGNDPSLTFHTPFFLFLSHPPFLYIHNMTKKKSMQELVKPLRRLSLLVSNTGTSTASKRYFHQVNFIPQLALLCLYLSSSSDSHHTPTPFALQHDHEQHDIVTRLPKEIVLAIFSMLSFQDLVQVQLVSKILKDYNKTLNYYFVDMSYMETYCTGWINMAESLSSATSTVSRPIFA